MGIPFLELAFHILVCQKTSSCQ